MSSEILQKEEEFRKLNTELEKRTRELMSEVDSVMKMQNLIANDAKQTNLNRIKPRTTYEKPGTTRNDYDTGDKWENYEDNDKYTAIPQLTKCLKTKITTLQNELENIKSLYKSKCNEVKQIKAEFAKMEEEKLKWQQLSHAYQDQREKCSNQISALNSRFQSKDLELLSLRKENEMLKKEMKMINGSHATNEMKLNKLLEETEKSRATLKNAKQEEKEIREIHRKQMNELITVNKRLERQVTELTNGFKKQMMLTDNLKKQKMYLESLKLAQITEDEFCRILDWKPPK